MLQAVSVSGQQTHGNVEFPMVMSAPVDAELDAVVADIHQRRQALLDAAACHGAVAIRGLPLKSPHDFDAAVAALDVPCFPYRRSLSNAVRVEWTERVFSANEAPPHVEILFHHEMAQTPIYPRRIVFGCLQAPASGGATPLCRSDILLARLSKERRDFIDALRTKGLRYSNVMPPDDDSDSGMGRSWRSTLGAEHRAQAEQRLRSLGYEWQWHDDDTLRATTPVLPAIRRMDDQIEVFFNQLIAAFRGWSDKRNDPSEAVRFGDGTRLDADAIDCASGIADELAYDHAWQVGDIVLVDNLKTMHARRPFEGKRQVLASLTQAETNDFTPDTNAESNDGK